MEYKVLYQDGYTAKQEIVKDTELSQVIQAIVNKEQTVLSVNPIFKEPN